MRSLWPHAQKTAAELGVPAKALSRRPRWKPAGAGAWSAAGRALNSHNLFGIKAGAHWVRREVSAATHEFVDGVRVAQRAAFRAYGSAADSFADYARPARQSALCRRARHRRRRATVRAGVAARRLRHRSVVRGEDRRDRQRADPAACARLVAGRPSGRAHRHVRRRRTGPEGISDEQHALHRKLGAARLPARAGDRQPQRRQRQHARLQPPARRTRRASGEAIGRNYTGAGVEVADLRRLADGLVFARQIDSSGELGRLQQLSAQSDRIDSLLSDSSTSLSGPWSAFFTAAKDVSASPTSQVARSQMLAAASQLTGRWHSIDSQLSQLDDEVDNRVGASVADVNRLSTEIANLNRDIVAAGSNAPPDLLDARAQRIDALSGLSARRPSRRTTARSTSSPPPAASRWCSAIARRRCRRCPIRCIRTACNWRWRPRPARSRCRRPASAGRSADCSNSARACWIPRAPNSVAWRPRSRPRSTLRAGRRRLQRQPRRRVFSLPAPRVTAVQANTGTATLMRASPTSARCRARTW